MTGVQCIALLTNRHMWSETGETDWCSVAMNHRLLLKQLNTIHSSKSRTMQ